jgi:hypothetical protein
MESNCSFAGMTLTEIFDIQPLQSLFIKFWHLGLTSEAVAAPEDAALFRAIRKNITFANCFTFEMPLRTYINYIDKVLQALATIDPRRTFDILLGHLRNNKVISVSFELFGVAFLQLFGRILELLNTQT